MRAQGLTRGAVAKRNKIPKKIDFRFKLLAGVSAVALVVQLAVPYYVSAASGSIKTVTGSCGSPVDANQYAVGDHVFINASGFDANTPYSWDISPVPAGSPVASGTQTTDANGDICFDAYVVALNDSGEFKASFRSEERR